MSPNSMQWTAQDGAPQGVNALAQAPDGVLWVGSDSGLYSFDGRTFTEFQARPGDKISALIPLVGDGRPRGIYRKRHFTTAATIAGARNISRKTGVSSRNEYPAWLTPTHMLTAAAMNQNSMKPTVATVMEDELPPASHLARPKQMAQSAKPAEIMIVVRTQLLPDLGWSFTPLGCRSVNRRVRLPAHGAAQSVPSPGSKRCVAWEKLQPVYGALRSRIQIRSNRSSGQ